jgi:hypothetical protein
MGSASTTGLAAAMGRLARPRLDCMNLRTASNTFSLPLGRPRVCIRPLTHLRRPRHHRCPNQTRSTEKWSAAAGGKCQVVHRPSERHRGAWWRRWSRKSVCVNLILTLEQRKSWGRSCWCCLGCGRRAKMAPRHVRWEGGSSCTASQTGAV